MEMAEKGRQLRAQGEALEAVRDKQAAALKAIEVKQALAKQVPPALPMLSSPVRNSCHLQCGFRGDHPTASRQCIGCGHNI